MARAICHRHFTHKGFEKCTMKPVFFFQLGWSHFLHQSGGCGRICRGRFVDQSEKSEKSGIIFDDSVITHLIFGLVFATHVL